MADVQQINRFDALCFIQGHNSRFLDAIGENVVKYLDDFTNSPLTTDNIQGWTATLVEAGGGESTVTLTDASGGRLLITTDANENDGVNMQRNPEAYRVDNNSFYFGTKFKVSEATQSDFFIGLSVTDTDILGNLGKRIGFRKVDGATGVAFEFEKTDTTSVSSIHTMVDDTDVTLEFLYDSGADKVYYFVNGVEYGPIAHDNLPDTEIKPSIHFLAGSTTAKTMSIDWIRVIQFGRS